MNKKTILKLSLFLLTSMATTVFTGCKSDDDSVEKVTLTIDDNLLKNGVEADATSSVKTVAVACNGDWTAALDETCDWCRLDDRELTYKGGRTLRLVFDDNETGSDRTTILYIEANGEVSEMPIRQKSIDLNGSGETFGAKGLGCGIDYDYVLNTKGIGQTRMKEDKQIEDGTLKPENRTKFESTKVKKNNQIFNMARIEELQADGKLTKAAYTEANIEQSDLVANLVDSCLMQSKTLDAKLTMGVTFGFIEFTAALNYNSRKMENRAHVDYVISRSAPMYNVVVSEGEISTYANDKMLDYVGDVKSINEQIEAKKQYFYALNGDQTLNKSQQKQIDRLKKKLSRPKLDVFNLNFEQKYYELYEAVMADETTVADNVLNTIDNLYGPFYIGGGDFGGAFSILCKVDTLYMKGEASIDAKVKLDVNSAFQLEGEVTYSEEGANLFRNSDISVNVWGGSANETTDAILGHLLSDDVTNYQKLQSIMKDWVNSMKSGGNFQISRATPISFVVVPIWNLFDDEDVQAYAQNYFLKKYADRGIKDYLGIMKGDAKAKSVEQIVNGDED